MLHSIASVKTYIVHNNYLGTWWFEPDMGSITFESNILQLQLLSTGPITITITITFENHYRYYNYNYF